jgi:hypothetical protein
MPWVAQNVCSLRTLPRPTAGPGATYLCLTEATICMILATTTRPAPGTRPIMPSRANATKPQAARIATVRRFNRFYTRLVGALDEGGYLHSPFTLT